jgi:hypothetical protein
MARRSLLTLAPAALVLAACAAHRPGAPANAAATLPPLDVSAPGVAQPQASESRRDLRESYEFVPAAVIDALVAREHAQALALADVALQSPSASPWLEYDRGEALAGLGRTDEAVAAFHKAEARFRVESEDRAGESAAMWGRARALGDAGRCAEARQAFDEYAAFVRASDPAAAELAAVRSGECRPVVLQR